MDSASAACTAFSAPVGSKDVQHLQYKRMAMGLKEAFFTFTKAISMTLAGLQGNEIEVYLDF